MQNQLEIEVNSVTKNPTKTNKMKSLFDTRPLKEEAWQKCKDNLDCNQMTGLETIVEGGSLPNAYRKCHLEQVI